MGCVQSNRRRETVLTAPVISEDISKNLAALDGSKQVLLKSWKLILAGQSQGFAEHKAAAKRGIPVSVAVFFFDLFYNKLYQLSPSTKKLFQYGGFQRQSRALMRMISSGLEVEQTAKESKTANIKTLQKIAKVHAVQMGIGVSHYEPSKEALLHALQVASGTDWNEELAGAWRSVMDYCLSVMVPVAKKYTKPTVVIVGGGFGGTAAAKALDETGDFNVVIIDRKKYFLHNIGSMRALVEPDFEREVLVPYEGLLKNGFVIKGEVTEIVPPNEKKAENEDSKTAASKSDSHGVVKMFGRKTPLAYDYLIIATGSSYAFPAKVAATSVTEAMDVYRTAQDRVKSMKTIAIAGGGAVGIELAGELKTEYPDKEIIVIHPHDKPLAARFHDETRELTAVELKKLGVTMIYNERVHVSGELKAQSGNSMQLMLDVPSGKITTESGKEIACDTLCFCTGPKINNKSFLGTFSDNLDAAGRLTVNKKCQVDGYRSVFSVGDCAALHTPNALRAIQNANTTAANIITLEAARKAYIAELEATGQVFANVSGAALEEALRAVELEDARETAKRFVMAIGRNSGVYYLEEGGLQSVKTAVQVKSGICIHIYVCVCVYGTGE
jgi:NADH dehydrogenase FAD-containing subunit/hemoglobin-like flavoprotein